MRAQLGEVVTARRQGTQLFRLRGEFDLSNAWKIEDALTDAIRAGRDDVVVDLAEVVFMDAQLVRALVRARAIAESHDIGFAVVPPADRAVWRVAQIAAFPQAA
jgi:anti-anti-sigma factor